MTLAPAPILPSSTLVGDVSISVTFTPSDPVGLTVVDVAGDEPTIARYLQLLDAAAARLAVYAADYRTAVEGDTEGSVRR